MSSEPGPVKRWEQIDQLLDEALSLEPARRQGFLEKACAGDEALRREVEALLAAHDQAHHFMEKPALDQVAQTSDQQESPSLLGRRLGSFEILSLLGRGGMGEVYRARDTRLDRIAALKILPSEVATDPERLRRFVREAKAASALNHPNIATIYEIGESDGIHWIGMELVEGETLAERLNRQSLGVSAILDIGMQAAEALEEAHSKGITHRDIKPANLMLTSKGKVKVLDFGLAKIARPEGLENATVVSETHTFPGLVMGTARYMSPEQVLGQEVDQRTDLFSLGVVLYEMVTGRQAFSGQTSTAIFDAILHKAPPSPVQLNPNCPAELERIINKSLEKDRTLRYQGASEIGADLQQVKRRHEQDQPNVDASKPKSHASLLWGTALLFAAMAAAAGFWFVQSRKETAESLMVPVPFTTDLGFAADPSFSPDGNQVAFSWHGNIHIKQIGSESPRRLTTDPHWEGSPVWSPDGQSIAFLRYLDSGGAAVMLIPANGGRERQVAELPTYWSYDNSGWIGHELSWHASGKWLAVSSVQGSQGMPSSIYLVSLETGEKRPLTSPPKDIVGDKNAAFSPDGRSLVFAREITGLSSELYLFQVSDGLSAQGEPKQLTFDDKRNVTPVWMADGKEIIYSSGSRHHLILCRMPAFGAGKPKPLPFFSEKTAFQPSVSLANHRLVYTSWTTSVNVNIWRCQIRNVEGRSVPPSKVLPSTQAQELAQYSPDGRSIAYVAQPSGSAEIWICDQDGTNPLQLTHLGGPFPDSPRWSPDGQNIVFSMASKGLLDLFAVSAQGGQVKQLTRTPFNEGSPSYSRDGKWIYFASNRSGETQIWKMMTSGRDEMQVTLQGGKSPQESIDGKTVFYLKPKDVDHSELWKMPVGGGEESRVLERVLHANFDLRQRGVYYATKSDKENVQFLFYDFANKKTTCLATIHNVVYWGFSVSRDEQWILYTQLHESSDGGANLMLVENFR